ncbi:MAG: alkaline phosphatase family protein [Pirellulales bacterium]
MTNNVVLLSIPGLREGDIRRMPNLARLTAQGDRSALVPSFPAVTCPVQANMTTGLLPAQHGVVANGFFWRDKGQVEMWTAWNDCIGAPQIWDRLHTHDPTLTSAVWFPLHSKGCGADFICTPAPIHNPDGSESLWCYTRPEPLYGALRDRLGHFPLKHFWGPVAGIASSAWIADSAVYTATHDRPRFFYVYLPHLDYAAQKSGPESDEAAAALGELDGVLERLITGFRQAYDGNDLKWIVAGEYAIVPVDHTLYPNRHLREAGLLTVRQDAGHQQLDLDVSQAWALVDHQASHIFVRHAEPQVIRRVADLFSHLEGVDEVLVGDDLRRAGVANPRSGEVVVISTPNSWQAYYWWLDDAKAPPYARTVDIHRKPGYDPVELFFDPVARGIPLDGSLVRGSHGAPVRSSDQQSVVLTSHGGMLGPSEAAVADTQIAGLVLEQFGVP